MKKLTLSLVFLAGIATMMVNADAQYHHHHGCREWRYHHHHRYCAR